MRLTTHWRPFGAGLALLMALAGGARGGYLDDVGFTLLGQQLGAATPDGTGVSVAHIESRTDTSNPDAFPNFLPDPADAEFASKTFEELSPNGRVSSHATLVGRRYYGNVTSMATGIEDVGVYWTDNWLTGGFLNRGSQAGPELTRFRVSNHSWVGSGSATLETLKRVDYVVETFDHIQVAAVNNDSNPNDGNNPVQPMLTGAFNVIATGLTNGNHAVGTTNSGTPYSASRTRPHLVVPATATSNTAPVVAAASSLLIQTAHERPELSHGSYDVLTDTGSYTVRHGETSEVIRATLMAGAQRHDVAGYNLTSSNNLDTRFGAGELDIYNSYHILVAGEQESAEQGGSASGISRRGFDYQSGFESGDTATYAFMPDANSTMLFATLSWNVDLEGGQSQFITTTRLSNFDLELLHFVDDGVEVVAASDGTNDTTENLWLANLIPGEQYALRVTRDDAFDAWDYGLAWQITHDPDAPLFGDLNGDDLVDLDDLTPFMLALSNPESYAALYPAIDAATIGDVNRDGRFDNADIDSFNVMLGGGPPLILDTSPANSVPEPATVALLAIAGAAAAFAALRSR
jgi:hypothetical protein